MSLHVWLAIVAVAIVAVVDTLLLLRVARAYRGSRRSPHLVLGLGIAASFIAVLGAALVFAAEGTPELRAGAPWSAARGLSFVGAGLAYGLVVLFAASMFGRSTRATGVALGAAVALVALAVAGVSTSPSDVATPATTAWSLRVPFVALAVAGSAYGFVRARSLSRSYGAARAAGRETNLVALGRMRTMSLGFGSMAVGQLPMLAFEPGGGFNSARGLLAAGMIMLGALGFVLACVATWATPNWLRARWEAT